MSSNGNRTRTAGKENPVISFMMEHRTLLLIVVCIMLTVLIIIMIMRIMEYRFRHAGIPAIAKRTDRLISHSRDFIIPLDRDTASELTAYFRLLDRVRYSDYKGTPEEIRHAYEIYDMLVTMIRKREG